MSEELQSVLIGTAGLDVAALLALYLTLARGAVAASEAQLRATARLAVVAIVLQGAHFAEELATGFQRRFPELLGLAPWSLRFFVSFNLAWLAIWSLSVRALHTRRRAALFPLWFLAIGGVANGLAHPVFALGTGGYFPGLFTAPLVGVAGILLWRRLGRLTDRGRYPGVGAVFNSS